MATLAELSPIERVALRLLLTTPAKRNAYAVEARVPWLLVEALEALFIERGYNIAAGRIVQRDAEKAARREREAARLARAAGYSQDTE